MRTLIALLVALAALTAARDADACGGLFCNGTLPPGSPGPIRIVQAGERVLFAQTASGVTMIVEVRYDGQPTSFAWLVPIPGLPAGMGLGDALGVSVPEVFSTLQAATDPTFTANVVSGANECARGSDSYDAGCGCGDDYDAKSASALGGFDATVGGQDGEDPYVQITDAARVGAYDAIHIEATNADALYSWLGDNGYFQDPAARPLLEDYIADGWSFIGLKLKNGASAGDVRPIVLHLGEDAPCVPLRLTRIAANDGMPIIVWILGPSRAIPKNYIHAVVNDRAVSFPNGPDYLDALADAVDSASGHAFVTELASPTAPFRALFPQAAPLSRRTLAELFASLSPRLYGPTLDRILRDELVRPDTVTADAWANDSPLGLIDVSHAELVHDLDTLAVRITDELVKPLDQAFRLVDDARVLTRLFTVQDAAEMTKDPIFGFNDALPMVAKDHVVQAAQSVDKSCSPYWQVTYPDGGSARFEAFAVQSSGFGASPDAPPLLRAEVLDEEGQAQPFDPSQAAAVDRVLDAAILGIPSIPSDFELKPAPRASAAAQASNPSGGCSVSLSGLWIALPLLFLFVRSRRYGSSM